MYPSNFKEQRQHLLERITSPMFLGIPIKDGKYYLDDNTVLTYMPVLKRTPYSEDKGITEKVAKSINWTFNPKSDNLNRLLFDNFNNYYFAEHSLFLLKEHFKMVIRFTRDKEMEKNSIIILNKLNQVNE